jgi:hypothetical protein
VKLETNYPIAHYAQNVLRNKHDINLAIWPQTLEIFNKICNSMKKEDVRFYKFSKIIPVAFTRCYSVAANQII